jgi:putative ABC transport system substrate-binding protein
MISDLDPAGYRRTMILRAVVVVSLGLFAALGPAMAQQSAKSYRIGYLQIAPRSVQEHLIGAFERGLAERGYVVGRDVSIEYRFADGKAERLGRLADDLVRRNVDVLEKRYT